MRINKSNWKNFLKNVGIRSVKTFFQTLVVTLPTTFAINEVDWKYALAVSAGAAVMSIITSFATGLPEVQPVLEEGDYNEV